MGKTVIQKIFEKHSESKANIDDIIDIDIDVRVARDFGGANVVKNLLENNLSVDNPNKTFFTFDCNPGGCDQKYAANQHICRIFARKNNIKVFDITEKNLKFNSIHYWKDHKKAISKFLGERKDAYRDYYESAHKIAFDETLCHCLYYILEEIDCKVIESNNFFSFLVYQFYFIFFFPFPKF